MASSSSSTSSAVSRFGFTEVYKPDPPSSALVDLVFVHGLNGNPHDTWTSQKNKIFWPAQLLPQFIEEEKVRVLVWGYDADITAFAKKDGVTKDKIHNHAEKLVAELFANRRIRKATERPIVFVGHSLGGLIIKRALITSSGIKGPNTEHLRSIYISTYGILFLGTPHMGSDLGRWGSYLEWLCSAVVPKRILDTQPDLLVALKTNSETLKVIHRDFADLMRSFHIFFFHEAKPTDMKGTFQFVVEEESAAPTMFDVERAGIQADHSHMCKFDSETAPGFDVVVEAIARYSAAAPEVMLTRWSSEKAERKAQRLRQAEDLLGSTGSIIQTPPSNTPSFIEKTPGSSTLDLRDSTNMLQVPSPKSTTEIPDIVAKPPEPFFIVPPGFRPNSFFVGMEKELQLLDRKLFDKRRKVGTACVLIHGQAGSGKSHLTREYVNKNRSKFKGGVFWINARLRDEMYKDYWQIAQKVVAKESPELLTSGNETGELPSYVEVVKAWFERRRDWLIVFDGITVDKDEEITELQKFVPDSKECSLLYVSRAKRLENLQRLLRPCAIKIPPLKEEDARKLLFKEIPILKPRDAQIKSATELVKKVGCLPLAITAISHRIAYTHEPLERYNLRSFSEDPKLGSTYRRIMDDLKDRGHTEAYNLINILCFYGPHLPVELVRLGVRALRLEAVEVRSSEEGEMPDLNITFAILMRHALIERNEPDDKDSMSSSRDSLVEPEPIDILKMHSVVQGFCRDNLNSLKILPRWLTYAVRLFCHSFREADTRIKSRREHGRVSDYREYLVHGARLREHSLVYESKHQILTNIRNELDPVLVMINDEIHAREPGSSQESIDKAEFQVSVFDRTSSSSSSGQSEPRVRTPGYRPTPLPLASQNEFGMELDKPSVDSPRSIVASSPLLEPRIVDHSPRSRFPIHYENEEKSSYPMEKKLSDSTMRPRATSTESDGGAWKIVPRTRKARRPVLPGSSFRRAPARTKVDQGHATGSVIRRPAVIPGTLTGSSEAITSLTTIHRASPPPTRGGGSLWSRSPSSRPTAATRTRATYAKVAAGSRIGSLSSATAEDKQALASTLSSLPDRERGRPREISLARLSSSQQLPLSHELIASSLSKTYGPYEQSGQDGVSSVRLLEHGVPQDRHSPSLLSSSYLSADEANRAIYSHSQITGANPLPLPFEPNISITPGYSLPALTQPINRNIVTSSPFDPASPTFPTGYYSQPLSREHSHNSTFSGTATEPTFRRGSPGSPYMRAAAIDTTSPRSRLPDGSPLRKSPKTAYPHPRDKSNYAIDPGSHDLLEGTGSWVANPSLYAGYTNPNQGSASFHYFPKRSEYSPPAVMSLSASASRPMSRHGSGPGVAVEEDGGLGIAHFGEGGEVVFGELEPIRLEDARKRWRAREEVLRDRKAARSRNVGSASERVADFQPENSPRRHEIGDGFGDDAFERLDGVDDLGIWRPLEEQRGLPLPYPELNRIPSVRDLLRREGTEW